MPDKGSLRSIKGARQKKKTFEAEVTQALKVADARMKHVEEGLSKAFGALNSLMGASNAASLLTAAVETWLDKEHPGWDDGMRAELKRKQTLAVERKAILQAAARPRTPEEPPEERAKMAERLLELSKELDSEVQDGTIAISLFLQAKNPDRAAWVLAELRKMEDKIPAQLKEVFEKLEARISEVQKQERRIWVPGDSLPGVLPPPPGR